MFLAVERSVSLQGAQVCYLSHFIIRELNWHPEQQENLCPICHHIFMSSYLSRPLVPCGILVALHWCHWHGLDSGIWLAATAAGKAMTAQSLTHGHGNSWLKKNELPVSLYGRHHQVSLRWRIAQRYSLHLQSFTELLVRKGYSSVPGPKWQSIGAGPQKTCHQHHR